MRLAQRRLAVGTPVAAGRWSGRWRGWSSGAPLEQRSGVRSARSARSARRPGIAPTSSAVYGSCGWSNTSAVGPTSTSRPSCITADPVGHLAHHGEVVRDEQVGQAALAPQPVEQREDLRLDRHVQRAGRLVEHQQVGLERERAGDRDALPLPARQLAGSTRRVRTRRARPGRAARPRGPAAGPGARRGATAAARR